MNAFTGFPQDLFDFLDDLSKNNNRQWFNANKERYQESVVEPVIGFIMEMGGRLQKISRHFVADPRPVGGSMFRIYRDTRFSKDKRPYKENVGCQFRHEAGKTAHAPGFYVHLEPAEVFVGAGIWMPPNPVLDKIRSAIADEPEAWSKIIRGKLLRNGFFTLEGEQLKRPPSGYAADQKHIEDIRRKSFFLLHSVEPSRATDPSFGDETEEAFAGAASLMKFITRCLGLRY